MDISRNFHSDALWHTGKSLKIKYGYDNQYANLLAFYSSDTHSLYFMDDNA